MTAPQNSWPRELVIVRHGESAGNVARDLALARGAQSIDIQVRDRDVPLSALGERQAQALGTWLAEHDRLPSVIFCSPFLRARLTARIAAQTAGWSIETVVDERLREKELGLLDRLTHLGVEARYPEEAALRAQLGKFYYRPPRGESWSDVILRLRSLLQTLRTDYAQEHVLIVSHQAVVLCFRYILENLSAEQIIDIDRAADVANCSITEYHHFAESEARGMQLQSYNFVAPLLESGAPVTSSPDAAQK